MKERGMIFNGEMVRAILDGRKTQTRRIVKGADGAVKFCQEWDINGEEIFVVLGEKDHTGMNPVLGAISCPFGAVGDRIWVRETFQGPLVHEELFEEYSAYPKKFETPEYCEYAADGGVRPEYCDLDDNLRHGWRPSIHMPRWASRILLEITDVRVERLNAISEEDAIAEGMQGVICPCCKGDSEYSTSQYDAETLAVVDEIPCRACESNRSKFFTLWDSIYGYGQHCIGEWVWVIEFKRVEGGAA
ncbi:morphogenetic protein [Klebsiella pneumoniae]|nr:morphogenetic protein [Klebsiella pneumoniae]HDH0550753.1 morphogenetic protein [Klebsiella pneumoniae]